jgi:hypothetical protein
MAPRLDLLCLAISCIVGCSVISSNQVQAPTGQASLCEIVAEPGRFAGERVAVEAQVQWALPHPAFLEEPACDAGGVVLLDDINSPGVREMYDAIRRRPDRSLRARFVGRILTTSPSGQPGLYLAVESVSVLR